MCCYKCSSLFCLINSMFNNLFFKHCISLNNKGGHTSSILCLDNVLLPQIELFLVIPYYQKQRAFLPNHIPRQKRDLAIRISLSCSIIT